MASKSNVDVTDSASRTDPTPFPLATVYIPSFGPCSEPHPAWLSLSCSVRWIYRSSEKDTPPNTLSGFRGNCCLAPERSAENDTAPDTFSAFRGHYCLALERLKDDDADWSDVERAVQAQPTENGVAITVEGKLSGRKRMALMKSPVKLYIVAENQDLVDSWINSLRIRIAPWRLLRRRIEEDSKDFRLSAVKLNALFRCLKKESDTKKSLESIRGSDVNYSLDLGGTGILLDGIDTMSSFVESVTVGLSMAAPAIQEVAETVADMAQSVTVVSAAFQVLSLGMMVVGMLAEKKRGAEALPRIRDTLNELHQAIVKSMVLVLHPDAQLDDFLVDAMFKAQARHDSILCEVELQMMRGGLSRFIKADELKKIEASMEELKDHVVNVVQSGKIAENASAIVRHEQVIVSTTSAVVRQGNRIAKLDNRLARHQKATQRELENLKSVMNAGNLAEMRERPRLTSYFVGREAEMGQIKEKLDEYRSAAIMQMGGAGKTQLMIAFAERAEKEGWTTDGCCYWIPAFGNKSDFLKVLADFAEALIERKVKDRDDWSVVLGMIKRKLRSLGRKWLICIDNADDPDVNGLLGDLCGIAASEDGSGWVLVTSRQGGSSMWEGMLPEQKVKLAPLSGKDAMLVLQRWKMGRLKRKISDDVVGAAVERLQAKDPKEYKALSELAGSEKVYGLGGLPLGLAQAGSYISRNNDTFAKYVELYKRKRGDPMVVSLFRKVGDSGLMDEQQRNVWTTWKLNVDSLSTKSRQVLQAYAFFDSNSVPEMLVKHLDPEFSSDALIYREFVLEELVKGASLLDYEQSEGKRVFKIHALVRDFVVFELRHDDAMLRSALSRAISAVRCLIYEALSGTECSVVDQPEHYAVEFTVDADEVFRHSEKLLLFLLDSPVSISGPLCSEHLMEVFRFSIRRNLCSEDLSNRLLRLLKKVYESEGVHRFIAAATHDLGLVKLESDELVTAEEQFDKTIEMMHRLYGDSCNKWEVAASLFRLGCISRRQRKFSDAERHFRSCLTMKQQSCGHSSASWSIAEVMHCLGDVLAEQGDMVNAERMFKDSYLMKRMVGKNIKNDFWLLKACYELMDGVKKTGILSEPGEFVQDWLDLSRRARDNDYSNKADVASLLRMLCLALLRSGKVDETKLVFHECLEVYAGMQLEKDDEMIYGHHDSRLAEIDYNFGERLRECVFICQRLHTSGIDHLGYAVVLDELGRERQYEYDYIEAELRFLESLAIKRRLLGYDKNHASISRTLHFLGCLKKENEAFIDSEKYFQDSLEMDQRLYGDDIDHWNKADTMRELADVLRKNGKSESSQHMYRGYLYMVQRLPKRDLEESDALHRLEEFADIAAECSEFSIAESSYRECLALWRKINKGNENNSDLLSFVSLQRKLTQTLLRVDKRDDAKVHFKGCLNTYGLMKYEKGHSLHVGQELGECFALCQDLFECDLDDLGFARILFEMGCEEDYVGNEERYHREALEMKRRLDGLRKDSPSISSSLFYLGKALKSKGELKEAQTLFEESLAMDRRIHGKGADNEDIASTMYELSLVLAERGVVDQSERIFRQSYEMYGKLPDRVKIGRDNSSLGVDEFSTLLYLLANKALEKGAYSIAESVSQQCIDMVRQTDRLFELAVSKQKLAQVLLEAGKLDESKTVFRDSLDLYSRVPEYTEKDNRSIFEVGRVEMEFDWGSAYRECVEIHRRLFKEGYEHKGFIRILHDIDGTTHSNMAELCCRESIAMHRQIFGETSDQACLSRTLYLLASNMKNKRAFSHSIDLYEESLEMDRRLYDESVGHQNLTVTMSEMVSPLCESGKLEEAECMSRKCCDMETRMGMESTKELLGFLCLIAERALKDSVIDVAERLFCEILEKLEGFSTSAHPFDVAIANQKLALSLLTAGKSKGAEERLLRALNGFEQASNRQDRQTVFFDEEKFNEEMIDVCARVFDGGRDHLGLANVLHNSGMCALNEDDYEKAELRLTSSLAMKRRLLDEEKGHESIAQTLLSLGCVMRGKTELDEAESFLRKALDMLRRMDGEETDSKHVLMTVYELSCVLGEKGELGEAELLMRQALEMGQRLNGGRMNRSDSIIGFYSLATSALKNRAFSDCERFCRACFDVGRHWMKPLHLATTYLVQAMSLVEAEKFTEGESVFQEAEYFFRLLPHNDNKQKTTHYGFAEEDLGLVVEEGSYFGDGSFFDVDFFFPEYVKTRSKLPANRLGDLFLSRILHDCACRAVESGDLEKAEKLFRDSLSMKRGILGESKDHASISLTLFALADVVKRRHLYAESEALMRESLRMDRRLQGERIYDLNVAITCHELAKVILKGGEAKEAERFYRECFEIKKGLLIGDFVYLMSLLDVGCDMLDVFALDEAERIFRECLSEARHLHGGDVDRTDIAAALYKLGRCLFEKDELDDAAAMFRESQNMYRRICGDAVDHFGVSNPEFCLGEIAFEKRQLEKASQHFNNTLEMERRRLANSDDHLDEWDICSMLCWLARVAVEEKDVATATKLLEDDLAEARKKVEEAASHEQLASVLLVKARVALLKDASDESEQLCRQSIEMSKRIHGADCCRPEIAESMHMLGEVRFKCGNVQDAMEYGNRSLTMYRQVYRSKPTHRRVLQLEKDLRTWQGE